MFFLSCAVEVKTWNKIDSRYLFIPLSLSLSLVLWCRCFDCLALSFGEEWSSPLFDALSRSSSLLRAAMVSACWPRSSPSRSVRCLVDDALDEEQKAIQQTATQFAQTEMAPFMYEWDRTVSESVRVPLLFCVRSFVRSRNTFPKKRFAKRRNWASGRSTAAISSVAREGRVSMPRSSSKLSPKAASALLRTWAFTSTCCEQRRRETTPAIA